MMADDFDAVQVTIRAGKVKGSATVVIGRSRVTAGIEELLRDGRVAVGASPVQRCRPIVRRRLVWISTGGQKNGDHQRESTWDGVGHCGVATVVHSVRISPTI